MGKLVSDMGENFLPSAASSSGINNPGSVKTLVPVSLDPSEPTSTLFGDVAKGVVGSAMNFFVPGSGDAVGKIAEKGAEKAYNKLDGTNESDRRRNTAKTKGEANLEDARQNRMMGRKGKRNKSNDDIVDKEH